jgi:tRNA pseudouridine38-40 synthase
VGWYHRPLDVAAIRAGAALLTGTHDFSAFRAAECQAKSAVKALARIEVSTDGPLLRFDFSADAFLQHMVRNIVGALVYVGAGRHPPEWIGELLASRDRTRAAPTFAADGLYLTGADYDARFALPPTRRAVVVPADA